MYYYIMFNNTYSNLSLFTGILTVGSVIYYYYYGGNPPFVTEKQISINDNDSDN